MRVTQSEFEDWKSHPVTEAVIKFYQLQASLARTAVGAGACKRDTFDATGAEYVRLLTYAQAYENIENVTYEDLNEDETDG